ncbi:hypothetical protein D5086_024322 [Populus alba]|uniref:Uncharacterized protein n=1 Tax=Populus alba TaxID=43335 RepID=A0ACC4B5M3_POPAL
MHKVQASDTADQQAALETTSGRNWDLPRKLKSGTVKIASTEHFSRKKTRDTETIFSDSQPTPSLWHSSQE